jgi:hypothetical protein
MSSAELSGAPRNPRSSAAVCRERDGSGAPLDRRRAPGVTLITPAPRWSRRRGHGRPGIRRGAAGGLPENARPQPGLAARGDGAERFVPGRSPAPARRTSAAFTDTARWSPVGGPSSGRTERHIGEAAARSAGPRHCRPPSTATFFLRFIVVSCGLEGFVGNRVSVSPLAPSKPRRPRVGPEINASPVEAFVFVPRWIYGRRRPK